MRQRRLRFAGLIRDDPNLSERVEEILGGEVKQAILDMRVANSLPVEVPEGVNPHEFARQNLGFTNVDHYAVVNVPEEDD